MVARMDAGGSLSARQLAASHSLNLMGATRDGVSTRQPLVNYWNDDQLAWQSGLDVANSENGDFVLAAKGRNGASTT